MPVEVKGAVALRKALRQFEPDLAKETTKEIANFMKPVVKKAKGYAPSNADIPSGWLKRENAKGRWAARSYDATLVKRGITYKTSPTKLKAQGWKSVATMLNKTPAGAIYETAGRKSGNTGNFSPRLGGVLKGNGQKMTGRALFRAYAEDQGRARENVIKAIERAGARLQARSKV